MTLSCSCESEYEWYYALSDLDYSACSSGTCYGCGKQVSIGDPVARIIGFEHDEGGAWINDRILGRMCDPCIDMVDNLKALGYCLDANPMFVTEAHAEYLELLPPQHRTKQEEKMSEPRLCLIWIGTEFGDRCLRLDWSNDRHHTIVIPYDAVKAEVVNALRSAANMIDADAELLTPPRATTQRGEK